MRTRFVGASYQIMNLMLNQMHDVVQASDRLHKKCVPFHVLVVWIGIRTALKPKLSLMANFH